MGRRDGRLDRCGVAAHRPRVSPRELHRTRSHGDRERREPSRPGRVASTDSAGEDTWFYLKALRAGFRVIGDYEARLSHLTTAAVWPEFTAEGLQPRVLLDEWAIRWPEGREAADAELRMHAGLQHLLRSGR